MWPFKNCEKHGHKVRNYEQRGTAWPSTSMFRSVADSAIKYTTECARCGDVITEQIDGRSSIQSLSLPSSDMALLKKDGWLPDEPKRVVR